MHMMIVALAARAKAPSKFAIDIHSHRATEQRDELAPFKFGKLHPVPQSHGQRNRSVSSEDLPQCGISIRPKSAPGQTTTCPSGLLCRLPPIADIPCKKAARTSSVPRLFTARQEAAAMPEFRVKE